MRLRGIDRVIWACCLLCFCLGVPNLMINRGHCGKKKEINEVGKDGKSNEWFPSWMLNEINSDLISNEQYEEFKSSKDFPDMIKLAQFVLWRFGYMSNIQISGKLDDGTSQAIKKYQKKRGLKINGELNKETFLRLSSDLTVHETPIIPLPFYYLSTEFWNSFISAEGTWVFENQEEHGMPLQTTKISCSRDKGSCLVATASIGIGGTLHVDQDVYEIERWDKHELVTKPLDTGCIRYVIKINRSQKTVKLFRTYIGDKEQCNGVDKRDCVLTLANGFDIYWKYHKNKNKTLNKILNIPPIYEGIK